MPFEVPEGWVWISGKDLFLPMRSTSPSGEKFSYIDIDAIDNKKNIAFPKLILTESAPSRASRYTQYGDTLFSMVRPYLKNIAKVTTEHCIASTGFYICHPYSNINADFIFYLMTSDYVVDGLNSFIKGDNSPSISSRDIDGWKFPLPPVAEQQRIVNEIKRYFSIISTIENEEVALKDSVKKAKSKVLELALSGKLTSDTSHYPQLPQIRVTRWEAKTIDEIFNHNTGKALNKSDSDGELYDYITTSNLYWNIFDLSSVRKMKFKSSEIEKCSVRKGDLLICEGGDVGRAAVWNYDFNIMIQNHIHRLRCRLEANPKFYYYVMMYYKSKGMISGKGIGLMGLSSKELGKLQVPYPQIEEQNDIVTYLDYTMKVFDSIAD